MIDELEALDRFRSDMSAPTPACRERVRRALSEAVAAESSPGHQKAHRPRRLRLAVSGVALASLVALLLARPGGGGSRDRAGLPGSLRTAILTAYDSRAASIFEIHQTITASNGHDFVFDVWKSPGLPQGGQQVHTRMRLGDANDSPIQDFEITYSSPAHLGSGGSFSPVGDVVDVDYATRSWSHQSEAPLPPPGLDTPDVVEVASLKDTLAKGNWTVIGPASLNGEQVIKLSDNNPPSGKSLVVWVDTQSYLPVQEVFTYTTGDGAGRVDGIVTSTLEYQPATAANLANLQVSIPAGFTRTAAPPAQPGG